MPRKDRRSQKYRLWAAAGLVVAAAAAAALWLRLPAVPAPQDAEARRERIFELYERYEERFPDVPALTPREAWEMVQRGEAVFADIRSDPERDVSGLPGARDERFFAEPPREGKAVAAIAYCTIGLRSGRWAKARREEGIEAYNLEGGILLWAHEGLPIVTPGGQPSKRVHVYGPRWNLLPSEYSDVQTP
jgi:rhodanese-related sulfurtransferase